MATQRGRSSADRLRSATTEHGPPKPGQGFATISDMISKLIEPESTEAIIKVSKSECCIKEIILHTGTPSLLTHDEIPLIDRSCQDLGACQTSEPVRTNFWKGLERPQMASEHCAHPVILQQQVNISWLLVESSPSQIFWMK